MSSLGTGIKQVTRTASAAALRRKPRHISPRGRVMLIGGLLLGVVAISLVSPYFSGKPHAKTPTGATGQTDPIPSSSSTDIVQTPDYPTLLPSGKTIDTVGGWTRVSPPDRNPVFAYADVIGTIPITVSEQPLPDDFKQNTEEKITTFAKSYSADHKLTIGTITAYIGTSAKGPQSVIFAKNNLLILLKSTARIDDAQWTKYISSLQ